MARQRLVRGQRDAEKVLALELMVVLTAKIVQGFRADNGGLIGPSQFVAVLLAYGGLSILVTVEEASEIAAIFGALIMFSVLLLPQKDGKIVGAEVLGALAQAGERASKDRTFAQPAKVK